MHRKVIISIVFALGYGLFGCNTKQNKISFAGEAQGTYYAITYYDAENRNLQSEADSLLAAFDQSVSLWVAQSIISRVNQGDTTVALDDIFRYNFELSIEMARLTNGYFDFTVSPLVEAWGFSFKGKIPMTPAGADLQSVPSPTSFLLCS
jgi:FAD:protein FMN transferase